jgi:PAS domain S-box-containing protein
VLSSARVIRLLMLIMVLSAGTGIWITWASHGSNLISPTESWVWPSDHENQHTPLWSILQLWEQVAARVNLGLLASFGLNLGLIGLIYTLLKRHGRYRQTLFAKAFRSSPLSITISTLSEGRYLDVNSAFLQMMGYERRDVIGRTASEIGIWADPEDRDRMLKMLGGANVGTGLHARLKTRTGEVRETNVSAEIIDVDGTPCMLAITQDVTEARRLENQLRQAQRLGAVGRLAGGVAHDFNNILTVIMGYSELAAHRLGAGHGVSKHLSEIKFAAERAASLTRQLLAFSRQQVLYPRVLDLNGVVNNLMRMLLRLIGEDISLSFNAGSVNSIKADLGQIEQILMNLVVNARDAMPQGGVISIETSNVDLEDGYVDSHLSVRPGRYIMLSVSDTGCGMDEKTVAQIFEPFFTTKAPGQGTGLGLSTVYGIVKQSEGYIWVYSELGRGTTFKIYFPEQTDGGQKMFESTSPLALVIGAETVLVVEDDEALRKLIVDLLGSAGYKVLQAANGDAALQLITKCDQQIDLVLTDMLMPAMSGIELSGRLRNLKPDLKVLLMSGYAGDLIARYRLAEGEIVLIEKPFTRHALLTRIRAALQ